jgi:Mrp family chromosome partitioning ATPase/capsular polysaccharide biosynthesis protein
MPPPESDTPAPPTRASDWITPDDAEFGFARDVAGIWAGRWIILGVVVLALLAAIGYLSTASKVYQAHSELLVTPLPASQSVQGLGLILQSSDPLRDVETAAGFVTTASVGQRVVQSLGLHESGQAILGDVSIAPVAESNIIDIGVNAGSPAAAERLANAFATQTVNDQTAKLDRDLDVVIPGLKAQIAAMPPGNAAAKSQLSSQLAQLETLRAGTTPDVRVAAMASLPTSPISPRKDFTLAAALAGGLVGGVGMVFLFQLLDPRLRLEDELGERFRLPILARIPRASRRRRGRRKGPIVPDALSPEAADAYRTLRAALTSSTRSPSSGRGRVILVTGSTPSEGKSTTAINLAAALAASDEQVMLIEGDLRRPSIGKALNIDALEGIQSVLLEDMLFGHFKLADARVNTALAPDAQSRRVRLLLANTNGAMLQPLSPTLLRSVLTAALSISDWVVIDGPPLLFDADLLAAAGMIDDVVLVTRLGTTVVDNLEETAEMLAQHGIRPAGFVVVGTRSRPEYY